MGTVAPRSRKTMEMSATRNELEIEKYTIRKPRKSSFRQNLRCLNPTSNERVMLVLPKGGKTAGHTLLLSCNNAGCVSTCDKIIFSIDLPYLISEGFVQKSIITGFRVAFTPAHCARPVVDVSIKVVIGLPRYLAQTETNMLTDIFQNQYAIKIATKYAISAVNQTLRSRKTVEMDATGVEIKKRERKGNNLINQI
ncbi:hypothetical protein C2S52_010658 [Perilla frutescens var. hirtella]|nr:hypothetical protein C2S52_010658 [Perilla frutescens var. hirtella]